MALARPKGGGRGAFSRTAAVYLTHIVHTLLERGSGLYVGPDCDGAINTMDVPQGGARGPGAGGAGKASGLSGNDLGLCALRSNRAAVW